MREVGIEPGLVDVVEEGKQLVILPLTERVELVVVAAAAFERETQERRAKGGHAVVDIRHAVFLFHRAPLGFLLMQAVEGRRQPLLWAGFREQVAGELPESKVVPRQIVVKRGNYPVPPRPHVRPLAVDLEAIAVGIPCEVEPVGRHPLPIPRTCQQPVEQPLIGLGARVGKERVDLIDRGGQARQIKRHAANQGGLVGLRLKGQSACSEALTHDGVGGLTQRLGCLRRRR